MLGSRNSTTQQTDCRLPYLSMHGIHVFPYTKILFKNWGLEMAHEIRYLKFAGADIFILRHYFP